MEKKCQDLIDFIETYQITSTQLADALDKTGVIPNCKPINREKKIVGYLSPVFCANGSNYNLHKELENVQEGSVCCIFSYNCEGIALVGDLVCKYLFNTKKIKGLIVHGFLRDFDEIEREKFPIWYTGVSPVGCSNKPSPNFPNDSKIEILNKYANSIVVCDSTGVVAIPSWKMNGKKNILNSIELIHHKEKIWEYCIQKLNWSTYKTICLKSYLKDGDDFSINNIDQNLKDSLIKLRLNETN